MTMPSVQALREMRPTVSLVERLLAAGLISENQLQRALREKARHDRPLERILVDLGMISDRLLTEVSGRSTGDEHVDFSILLPNPDAIGRVSKDLAKQHCMFPIDVDARTERLTLAVTEAFNFAAVDKTLGTLKACASITTVVAAEAEIKSAINRFYDVALTLPKILRELDGGDTGIPDVNGDSTACPHPLDRLLDAVLFRAMKCGASAIHFEPEQAFVRLRYRIDGVLSQALVLQQRFWPDTVSRLIALPSTKCGDNTFSSSRPASISLGTHQKRLTLARQPTQHGDDVIVQILPMQHEVAPLNELGLDNTALTRIRLMMARQDGLIIVAGPPDSGKTSTLYAMLGYRSDESVHILTHDASGTAALPFVRQVPTAEACNLVESALVDSCLFQGADVLAVGELADGPSAALALSAAMTGRQVLTTLAAKSASAVVPRLTDIGLTSQQLAGNIIGIVAQRLVRKLCTNCRQPYSPQRFEQEILGASQSQALRLYRAGACEHCHYLGYRGRIGLFETVVVDKELDELLARGASPLEIRRKLHAGGSGQLADEAIRQVLAGATSLGEASRVVDLSARLI
ncbi:MAG: GspE/PulE family protein [Woeseiaceae bacterium]